MSNVPPVEPASQVQVSRHEFFAKYYVQSLAILISVAVGIFASDSRRHEAESALARVKAKNAGTGALQISGNVYQGIDYERPSLGLRRCTLSLSLSTAGEVPVKISNIAVKLRKGKLPEVWNERLFDYEESRHGYCIADRPGRVTVYAPAPDAVPAPAPDVVPTATAPSDPAPAPPADPVPGPRADPVSKNANIFVIAPTLPIWSEAATMEEIYDRQDGTFGTIYPNQDRPFAIDFLVSDGTIPELVLIEVEILLEGNNKEDEQVRKWSTWIGTGPGLRCGALQGPNGSLSSTCFPVY